jgi:hypothetical protein
MINVGNDSLTQRALRCLSIVATRYYSSPEDKETRKNAVKALREMGNLYMTYAIDYKSAYRNLLLARQIAEEDKILQELPYIYMSLANLYSVNTTTENSMRLSPLTAESLSKSLEAAVAADNDTILIPLLTNIILVSLNHPEIQPDLAKSLDHVREHKFAVGSEIGNFTNLLIAGLDKYWAGDLKGGVDMVLKSKERGIEGAYHERTEYGLSLIVILMLEQAGDYPRAIEYVRDVMDKAASCGHTDYELAMYSRLVIPATGRYRVSIPGSQSNSYSGLDPDKNPDMPLPWAEVFFEGGGKVPGLTFNDVVIAATDYDGVAGSLPSEIEAGEPYGHSFTFSMDDLKKSGAAGIIGDWGKLRVVAVVMNARNSQFVNCISSLHLDGSSHVSSAVEDIVADTDRDNPVETIWYDLCGRRVSDTGSGLFIRLDVYSDGSVRSTKVMR